MFIFFESRATIRFVFSVKIKSLKKYEKCPVRITAEDQTGTSFATGTKIDSDKKVLGTSAYIYFKLQKDERSVRHSISNTV
jgi:hypothetical protein